MKKIAVLVVVFLIIAAGVQAEDFTLTGTQTKDVTTTYSEGYLYDSSLARILSGGSMDGLYAYENSTVNISGGSVGELWVHNLRLNGPQRVNITGGTVSQLIPSIHLEGSDQFSYSGQLSELESYGVQAAPGTVSSFYSIFIDTYESSIVDVSGGSLYGIFAHDNSHISLSGGGMKWLSLYDYSSSDVANGVELYSVEAFGSSSVNIYGIFGYLNAYDYSNIALRGGSGFNLEALLSSTIKIYGSDFVLGQGLSWGTDGKTIIGTGTISGKWIENNEFFDISINSHDSTATIMAIPEPSIMILLGLGGLLLSRRKK